MWIILSLSSAASASDKEYLTPTEPSSSDVVLGNNGVLFDPDTLPPLAFPLNSFLSLGGKVNLVIQGNRNRDLDRDIADDALWIEPELTLAGLYQVSSHTRFLSEFKVSDLFPLRDDARRLKKGSDFKIGENYWLWQNRSWTVQIGRQRFKDHREWRYNEKLDAVRLCFQKNRFNLDLSVSAKRVDPGDDPYANYIVSGTYQFVQQGEAALYGIFRRDREDPSREPAWYGLSWRGKPYRDLKDWLEFAVIRGRKGSEKLQGTGLDVGGVFRFRAPLKPYLTIGYAYGSGDENSADGVNKSFRQTGIQDNDGSFGGNTQFKYYGEVLHPELSNLAIWTGGLGVRPVKGASFDLVFHSYRQVEKDPHARFKLQQLPTGKDPRLGEEIDFIYGAAVTEKLRLSLSSGVFSPGPAYLQRDRALSGKLELQYTF